MYEVGKTSPAVDLDDRQPLAIFRFERVVARDVDELELESELLPQLLHLGQRALAQVTPLRVIDDDARSSHAPAPTTARGCDGTWGEVADHVEAVKLVEQWAGVEIA